MSQESALERELYNLNCRYNKQTQALAIARSTATTLKKWSAHWRSRTRLAEQLLGGRALIVARKHKASRPR